MTRESDFLSLRDATFRLGERLVFPHTTWSFGREQHWAVLGANGSGKSLFADALRGRLPLVRGELQYHFRPPPGLCPEESIGHVSFEERRREVHGAVAQSRWNSIEQDGALKVRDFLSYEQVMEVNPFEVTARHQGARRGFERRRARAAALLRVEPFFERTLLSLSNGETQRVRLARALCHPFRLLILDEPFFGLDAATRAYFRGLLEQLMATRLRVLLITTREEDLPKGVTHLLRVEACKVVWAGRREKRNERVKKIPKRFNTDTERGPSRPKANARAELVRLRNVTVRYGSATILRGVNWTVYEGESWALLGPNGSGKSTLLSLLLGDNPQAYVNDVRVLGRQRGTGDSIWDLKRQIGWVSPELHLHFDDAVSCFGVVASGFHETIGLFEPVTRAQRATAREWLERFDLLEFARNPLFTLSTGLQRMALLARALVKQPRLLALDEPCQGLDDAHRELLIRTVDDLLRSGEVTGIYVTHRAEEIPASVKRVLRLG